MNPQHAADGRAARAAAFLLVTLLAAPAFGGLAQGQAYVFVSQPTMGRVVYIIVDAYDQAGKGGGAPKFLVTKGLEEPYGLAFDKRNMRLFVADAGAGSLYMYKIIESGEGVLTTDGQQYVAIGGVTPRWVSVDQFGDVYCTDESESLIVKVTKTQVDSASTTPTTVYSAASVSTVSGPSGIASDGTYVYWGNKVKATEKGSVIRGLETPVVSDLGSATNVLAADVEKVYGVCTSQNNVFYTAETTKMYGVKKTTEYSSGTDTTAPTSVGSTAVAISDIFDKPRGCAWDGDGTIFVADRAGSIYAFPSSMHAIAPINVFKVQDIADPFGLATYTPQIAGGMSGVLFGGNFLGKKVFTQLFGVR